MSRHIEGKKLDKTVWNLLNFNALVKYHVKVILKLDKTIWNLIFTVYKRLCATKDDEPFR